VLEMNGISFGTGEKYRTFSEFSSADQA